MCLFLLVINAFVYIFCIFDFIIDIKKKNFSSPKGNSKNLNSFGTLRNKNKLYMIRSFGVLF